MKQASKTHSTLQKFQKDPQEREEQQLQCNSPKNISINFPIYNVHPLSPKSLLWKKKRQPSKNAVTCRKVQERFCKNGKQDATWNRAGVYFVFALVTGSAHGSLATHGRMEQYRNTENGNTHTPQKLVLLTTSPQPHFILAVFPTTDFEHAWSKKRAQDTSVSKLLITSLSYSTFQKQIVKPAIKVTKYPQIPRSDLLKSIQTTHF